MSLSRESIPNTITKEEVNGLESIQFSGKIHLIEDATSAAEAVMEISRHDLIGFDTETKPSFRRGQNFHPALVQIATDKKAWLFRVQETGLNPLIPIFENGFILKTGVALRDDIKQLQAIRPFDAKGFVDLTSWAEKAGFEKTGLRNLTAMLFGKRLSKAAQVSNWEAKKLTRKQIIYAATDAWISREIHCKMMDLGLGQPLPGDIEPSVEEG